MRLVPKIQLGLLCGLSTNTHWQGWLYRNHRDLYQELQDHLKVSQGCGHNREKMTELVEKIFLRPGGKEQTIGFLQANFPAMLDYSDGPVQPTQPAGPEVPFEIKNENLLTFPRRTVIENANPVLLQDSVAEFLRDKAKHDFVIVGPRAFIEYLPQAHARLATQIPSKNWIIPAFKQARGL